MPAPLKTATEQSIFTETTNTLLWLFHFLTDATNPQMVLWFESVFRFQLHENFKFLSTALATSWIWTQLSGLLAQRDPRGEVFFLLSFSNTLKSNWEDKFASSGDHRMKNSKNRSSSSSSRSKNIHARFRKNIHELKFPKFCIYVLENCCVTEKLTSHHAHVQSFTATEKPQQQQCRGVGKWVLFVLVFPSFYSGMTSVCEGKSALCGWMCVCDGRKENKENALSLIPLQDAPKCTVDRQNVK